MELADASATLTCAECGEPVEAAGYLPADEGPDGFEPLPDGAVCDACGFNAVGMAGCAPELDDLAGAAGADALLYVRVGADGLEVASVKR